jgi:hypothetical protein
MPLNGHVHHVDRRARLQDLGGEVRAAATPAEEK